MQKPSGLKRRGRPQAQEGLKRPRLGALGPLLFPLGTRLPLIGLLPLFPQIFMPITYGPCMAYYAFIACELLGSLPFLEAPACP